MTDNELNKQISFISELEKLKIIYRKNSVIDKSRDENSAEHSWHISLMAIVLQDYYPHEELDINKVVRMLLVHDIVEIDAGDTFLYDEDGNDKKENKEKNAANRIFGLLPDKQKNEFIDLWEEFEMKKTHEAIYASVIDNLQPLINHYLTAKENYNPYKMRKSEVIKKKNFIKNVSIKLWNLAEQIIDKSVEKGLYIND
ncbi:MAG TPA: HD domain-containing protein [Spirochaetota bacterium]|nr:HD domain-containing protein [Spirochaetota bacterium]